MKQFVKDHAKDILFYFISVALAFLIGYQIGYHDGNMEWFGRLELEIYSEEPMGKVNDTISIEILDQYWVDKKISFIVEGVEAEILLLDSGYVVFSRAERRNH